MAAVRPLWDNAGWTTNGFVMTSLTILYKSVAALVAMSALAACTSTSGLKPLHDPEEKEAFTRATVYAGPRSPASAYCVQMGGALLNTPKGKNTLCRFPDGKEMDPWDLFWRDNPMN